MVVAIERRLDDIAQSNARRIARRASFHIVLQRLFELRDDLEQITD